MRTIERVVESGIIDIDTRDFEYCSINTEKWLEKVFFDGEMKYAPYLPEDQEPNSNKEYDDIVIQQLCFVTGEEWESVYTDNVYNHENDFSDVFYFTVYARKEARRDWLYQDDIIIRLNVHKGGDIRGNYGRTRWYRLDDISESGFLDWMIGWNVQYSDNSNADDEGEYGIGYSQNPTCHLRDSLDNPRMIWSNKRQCFIGFLGGRLIKASPYTNHY